MLKGIVDVGLQKLLVGNANLDRLARRTVFLIPPLDQRNINGTTSTATLLVEWMRSPVEDDSVGRVLGVDGRVGKQWTRSGWQGKVLVGLPAVKHVLLVHVAGREQVPSGDGVDRGIKVKGRQVRILRPDIHDGGGMVEGNLDRARHAVVHKRICNFVFRADGCADDDLVDVVELVPVFLGRIGVPVEGLEFRPTRDSHA